MRWFVQKTREEEEENMNRTRKTKKAETNWRCIRCQADVTLNPRLSGTPPPQTSDSITAWKIKSPESKAAGTTWSNTTGSIGVVHEIVSEGISDVFTALERSVVHLNVRARCSHAVTRPYKYYIKMCYILIKFGLITCFSSGGVEARIQTFLWGISCLS